MGCRVLIAGGGTGGHLFPGLAIADILKNRGAEILWVGTRNGLDAKIIPPQGYRIEYLSIAGFRRRQIWANALLPLKLMAALWQSDRILRSFKPQAALGTGGYVCGPILFMAAWRGVPIVLQEQNSFPGITTRMLARGAHKVFLNFEEAAKHLPTRAKWQHVGNPVRSDIRQVNRREAMAIWGLNPEMPTLLVFGGSQGAMSLNRAVAQALPDLGGICNVIWGRGERDAADVSAWRGPGKLAHRAFIDNMAAAYSAADLAICRSGAMTLSELQSARLPAILVPYPFAAGNHQFHNAQAYTQHGGAIVIEDHDFNAQRLLCEARRLLQDDEARSQMQAALAEAPRQDAAEIIAAEIFRLAGE